MVVLREPGEVFLLRHTVGPGRGRLGRARRPDHARTCSRVDDLAGRPDLARRHRRARERLAPRRVREPRAPARARPHGARVARAAAAPPVQQLRRRPRRPPRDEGLRRRAPRPRPRHPRARDRRSSSCCIPERSRSSPLRAPRTVGRASVGRRRRRLRGRDVERCSASGGTALGSRPTTGFAARYRTVARADVRVGRRDRARRGLVPRQRRRQPSATRARCAGRASRRLRCISCASTSRPRP